jgi:hypothetical protein
MAVKNEKQYEALKDKGMSKERAPKIANSPKASSHGGKTSGSGGDATQGGRRPRRRRPAVRVERRRPVGRDPKLRRLGLRQLSAQSFRRCGSSLCPGRPRPSRRG